jgi:hypothetical protein
MHSNILLPLFYGHITKKKPQTCMMLCATWRVYTCLTLCHGLQGFLNYTYFQEGYRVHSCTHNTELPKATHQDGFLKGYIVCNGWLFFKWLKRRDLCCLLEGWDH